MSVEAGSGAPGPAGGGGQGVNNDMIRLVSDDGKEFLVPTDVARVSCTFRLMLDDLGGQGDGMDAKADKAIQLDNVSGDILERVIAWAVHHKDDPPFEEDDNREEKCSNDISPWDIEFLKDLQQKNILFDLILAANYMKIAALLDCTCKTVANTMIKGKTPEEIRATFNIQNDFTPAEEEQIRKENEELLGNK